MKERMRRAAALLLTGTILLGITACGQKGPKDMNLVSDQEEEKKKCIMES